MSTYKITYVNDAVGSDCSLCVFWHFLDKFFVEKFSCWTACQQEDLILVPRQPLKVLVVPFKHIEHFFG